MADPITAYLYLSGSITAGIIISSVSVAIIQFINAGLKSKWDNAAHHLGTHSDTYNRANEVELKRQHHRIISDYETLTGQYFEGIVSVQPALLVSLFIFAALHFFYALGHAYAPILLPIVEAITLIALFALAPTIWWISRCQKTERVKVNQFCDEADTWCKTSSLELSSEVTKRENGTT